jgi:acyl-CoA synthetase (NDP forming)
MDEKRIREIAGRALAAGADSLTEIEGQEILGAMGVEIPGRAFYGGSAELESALEQGLPFAGDRAVVKVVSPEILHKTEVGGVAIVPNRGPDILAALRGMEGRLTGRVIEGYTVNEFVSFEPSLGSELIIGYRLAGDFGPVVGFGAGGIHAELLARSFKAGTSNLFFSPATADRRAIESELSHNVLFAILCGGLRGTRPIIEGSRIVDLIELFVAAASVLAAAGISEFEVNPIVVARPRGEGSRGNGSHGGAARLVALDALAKLQEIASRGLEVRGGALADPRAAARPVAKIDRLLRPASAAVAGASEKAVNNGRIILRNLIGNGFDRSRLYVVKPGSSSIEGCPCYASVAELPEKVDLLVLAIPAQAAARAIAEAAESDKAETIIVIPGGLEEKAGTEELVARMRSSLERSRGRPGGGPLLNGGNCLGLRSVPGKYNTLFIPEYKLPMPAGAVDPVAVISQSGAFAICRVSKHPAVNPKYLVTCGNQMDLTIGDYLERLAEDPEISVFAVYVEGFRPLDGEKALRACERITRSGRSFILYRAGRSAAGAAASASHTASIAGDYPVTRALFAQAGAVVAESLDEFDDAVTAFARLRGKVARGRRLGAVSNAGFECVAIADNLGILELVRFSPGTAARLETAFARAGIGGIVDVHNPVDLTPMASDAAYDEVFSAVLDDPGVDCGALGVVPLTAMMRTLPPASGVHSEDLYDGAAIAARAGDLMARSSKPWVAVVDAGALYDPLVRELERRGVPTYRSADRALRALNHWISANAPRGRAHPTWNRGRRLGAAHG